eukprot:1159652-Pelagomonas_calceolata.AAC.8
MSINHCGFTDIAEEAQCSLHGSVWRGSKGVRSIKDAQKPEASRASARAQRKNGGLHLMLTHHSVCPVKDKRSL